MAGSRRGAHRTSPRPVHARASRGRHARPPARRRGRPVALLPLVAALVLVGAATTAHAYWTSAGGGTAVVGSATAAPLVVAAVGDPLYALHPGLTTDLRFSLENPNAYPVSVTTLTGVSVTSDEFACPGGTFIVLPDDVATAVAAGGYLLPSPILVPPGPSPTGAVLPELITLAPSAPDACQGVLFTVALAFAGAQA